MDAYIEFNDFLETILIPISFSDADFRLSGHFILGLILLGIAGYLRRIAVSGWDNWEDANKVIGLGDIPAVPAVPMARKGCFGALTNGIVMPICWLLIVGGLDYIFFSGNIFIFFLQAFTA